ncbi:signal peptidase II [Novosphingopyxis sp.]|uniref:signal peptidase II n=1 Tax=Novosphingopyxis sp. TaxID=2709690 RepID=UPI003B5A66C3
MTRIKSYGLILAALVVLVDQAVKYAMIVPLSLQSKGTIYLLPIFDLTWAENKGVSMGMFQAGTDAQRWMLVGLTAVLAIAVLVWMWRERRTGDVLALGLILGGAIGNIIDRARFGYVVDYADFHIGGVRPFFIFNLADACITIGVLILLARALLMRNKPGQRNSENVHA